MEFTHLETFVCVVRKGSLSGAARSLHYSQPTVTAHVQSLERHLGALLLERTNGGTSPTAAGQHVYARAVLILQMVSLLKQQTSCVEEGVLAIRDRDSTIIDADGQTS